MLGNGGGDGMLEFGECLGNILRHRNVHITGVVVPCQSEAEIAGAGPIFGDGIFGFKSSKEMIGISFAEILDSKVVDCEGERGSTRVVSPETRCELHRCIAKRSKVVPELFVGEDAGFFQAVHAFAAFKVSETFGIEVGVSETV